MRVTVIAPHPDDEAIGCGGALALHAAADDSVNVIFLTSGELGLKHLDPLEARSIREQEAKESARTLGVKASDFIRAGEYCLPWQLTEVVPQIAELLSLHDPELVYVPHPGDEHPDHQVSLSLFDAASAMRGGARPAVRGYEVWTPMSSYGLVVDITSVMELKTKAIEAHRSQLGYYDYVAGVTGLNAFRGALAGRCRYAEVFSKL